MEYVFLGDRVKDGIFAWISAAIDVTGDSDVTPAAYRTKNGGVSNPNSGMGMGPPPWIWQRKLFFCVFCS